MQPESITNSERTDDERYILSDRTLWPSLLVAEEERCRAQGFGAGIISVNFAPPPEIIDARDRGDLEQRALDAVESVLRWTDRACRLGETEIGLLVIPLRTPADLRTQAEAVHRALVERGLTVRVGYAARNAHTGLSGAAARADAAAAFPSDRSV